MDDYNLDDLLREDVEAEINRQIYKCFKKFGIEGTESKINELYLHMPELKEKWLTQFLRIVKG